jgi:hypothetical protein
MSESTLTLGDPQLAIQLFGPQDSHLRKVRNQLGVAITHRNGTIRIAGPSTSVDIATGILEKLKEKLLRGSLIDPDEIDSLLQHATAPASKLIHPEKAEQRELGIGNNGECYRRVCFVFLYWDFHHLCFRQFFENGEICPMKAPTPYQKRKKADGELIATRFHV